MVKYVWPSVLMLLLLAGSAFFSGVETAFFNLSRRQINMLGKSRHRLQNLTARLLDRPRELLSCLLFGNMTVNVLFFATASVLAVKIREQSGVTSAAAVTGLCFCGLVLLGEILPKSLAYANSRSISISASLPVFLCIKILAPLQLVLRLLILEPALVLLAGPSRPAKAISTAEFIMLIEQLRKRRAITADENKLLTEIIELGFLKVRDCLQPRVDMVACAVADSSSSIREVMQQNHLTKLPVYVGTKDNIIGQLHLRSLLLHPETPVDKLVQPVHFVPEQKTIESLLEFFRKTPTDTAIVVDEYGGIAGSICLEDIAEELLGPIEITKEAEPIEKTGPFEYRLAGYVAIHDWAKSFSIDPTENRISTVGGLVTALLGKIPKTGDVAYLKNLKFTVESVRKHRIETVILTFEPLPGGSGHEK